MQDGEENWDFESMLSANEAVTSSIIVMLRELQRVGEDGDKTMHRTVAEAIELDKEGLEMKRKNAKLSDWNMGISLCVRQ